MAKRAITRLLTTFIAMFIILGIWFVVMSAGVVFTKMSNGIADYNTMSESQLKNHLPVQGTIYTVYDCIATQYSSENGVETDEAYYYLVEFDDENGLFMVIKTNADSALTDKIDELCDAFYSDNEEVLIKGVYVDGALVKTDSGVVEQYDSWVSDMKELGVDLSDCDVLDYTLDCTTSYNTYKFLFLLGVGMITVFLVVLVLFVIKFLRPKKNTVPVQNQYQNQYQPNNYYPQNNIPQSNVPQSYIPQSNIPQSNIPQSNIPQPNIPQPSIPQPNVPQQNASQPANQAAAQNSAANYDPYKTIYSNDPERISLNKKDY